MPPSEGAGSDQETGSTAGKDEEGYEDEAADKVPSPLLTTHRFSTQSMKEINLEGTHDDESIKAGTPIDESEEHSASPPEPPPKPPSRLQSLWGAPPPPPKQNTSIPPPPPPRKLTSPFAWLSRGNTATQKELPSPPVPSTSFPFGRRPSAATVDSNTMVEDDGASIASHDPKRARNSLRDRFKLVRMREEAGVNMDEGEPGGEGVGLGIGSPSSNVDEKEGGLAGSPDTNKPPSIKLAATPSPNVNPRLAPGTASGIAAGPDDPSIPVDWDLWQNVVYEGPAAVARTSPAELNRAIAGGIPSAIRGVVWQVLAESKNEDLERVYRELLSSGTSQETPRSSSSTRFSKTNGQAGGKDKESVVSSASSMHSDYSTPATTITNGLASPPPINEKEAEIAARAQAKRTKEDAAALQKLEKAIRRDLGARTSYSKYAVSAGLQEGLFGVCKAYALFDEGVGYAQGMNFLAMPLLFNMPEEEAFSLMVRLMNQYHLRDMFIQDMPGLHLHLYQFERLLEDFEPALYCHLHRRGVTPQLYATQWFLTLFAYRFPLQLVLRIYDLILSEGLESAILKFAVVLMQRNAQTLLAMNDMKALTDFLKDKLFDVYIDRTPSANSILESGFFGSSGGIDKEVYRADTLVQDACSINITPEMLKVYTLEWEEKVRGEAEREAELEALRTSNLKLASQVRSLEQRAEKSDTEHVQMASEVVRVKVESEEMKDANEALQSQVDELKEVVQRQPEEIENRLQDEMDRIMKRNIEVQNENRALEEQMADMERDLVDTKMMYAEVSLAFLLSLVTFRDPHITLSLLIRFTPRSTQNTRTSSRSGRICEKRWTGERAKCACAVTVLSTILALVRRE